MALDTVKFWGSPVTPPFFNCAFNQGPAYRVLDRALPFGEEVGCPKLRAALDTRLRPKLHVFGHVHENYGQLVDGTLTSVNAAFLDHLYHPVNAPVVVSL